MPKPASSRVIASLARRGARNRRRQHWIARLRRWPEATPGALLQTVRWPHAREPVRVVGHQPTLGLAAARGRGVMAVRAPARRCVAVVLHAVMAPDLL